jgi:general nucleoside transport system permease protein
MTLSTFYFLVQQTMFYSIPLLIVAIGGMYSERSGVVNIALEGIMIIGAFVSIFFMNQMQSTMSGQLLLVLAMLIAAATGMILSFFHAYASINMKANQVISGTALNLFAPAFAIFTARMLIGVQQVTFMNTYRITEVPVLSAIPILGDLLFKNTYLTTFVGFAILIVATIVLYKTRFGLRLRACGEHPQAADAAGVSVKKMRYIGVLISGALAGLGGLVLMVPVTTAFDGQVAGYGFLALAVLIFGQWRPGRILFAAFFFGLMKTISAAYTGIPVLLALGIPSYMFKMTPYLATIVILTFTSKKSAAPKAAGEPYDAGKR